MVTLVLFFSSRGRSGVAYLGTAVSEGASPYFYSAPSKSAKVAFLRSLLAGVPRGTLKQTYF